MERQLLILGETLRSDTLGYRGTWRLKPEYCSEFESDHPVNLAWIWMAEEGVTGGAVHDRAQAVNLIELYRTHKGEEFELVEVTSGEGRPAIGGVFLGFDIAENFGLSLLASGLQMAGAPCCDTCSTIMPLLRLFRDHFAPKLNTYGLLPDYETAAACLECMAAIQKLHPGFWESRFDFDVVGIYLVDATTP